MQADEYLQSNRYFGKVISITRSRNTYNSNKTGFLVNETKNMLYLINQKNKSLMRIPKNEICEYKVCLAGQTYTIDGKRLLGRPEEVNNILKW